MKNFIFVIVVVVALVAGIGAYRGWFTFGVDNDKIEADKEKVVGHK